MAKPDKPGKPEVDALRGGGRGQDKVYEVYNPATGETRTVTQREWREQKLGQQGFVKPVDMDETEVPEEPKPEEPPV